MPDGRNTKNYFTDGGDTLVIGGALVFDEGAEIVGLPAAESVPDSSAKSIAELVKDYNDLLAALRTAGLMHEEE